MSGIPPLQLSSGPAVAEAGGSGYGSTSTGVFNFKQPQARGIVETVLPWVVIGGIVWVIWR